MTFNEYEEFTHEVAIYPNADTGDLIYPALGLTGEAGEVADHIKKIIRDDHGNCTEERRGKIILELGDVLYYLVRLGVELEVSFEQIAEMNRTKLLARKLIDQIHGEGSSR